MIILEENFRWNLEAFASEVFILYAREVNVRSVILNFIGN